MSKALDLTSLFKALARFAEGLARYRSDTGDTQIRDGLILRFGFAYEISHKMLKRYLETTSPNQAAFDSLPFANLIRSGNEQGLLLGNWSDWKRYREIRSRTGDAYDEDVALGVVAGIPAFMGEGEFLLKRLRERSA